MEIKNLRLGINLFNAFNSIPRTEQVRLGITPARNCALRAPLNGVASRTRLEFRLQAARNRVNGNSKLQNQDAALNDIGLTNVHGSN